MAWYRCRHTGSGGGVTPIGDATDGDVLSGKTYMNANGASTGTMTNRGAVSATLNTSTTSYTVPEGYHNGSGTVSITTETKTQAPSTLAIDVTPTSGKVLSKVTVSAIQTETKTQAPSTSAVDVTPSSGKYLTKVTVSAISPQRTAGVAATSTGRDSSGAYVYFPYGWHPNTNTSYGNYTRLTDAQAVATCNKQEKTSTPTTRSATAATVTPDSGKMLSKVTVNTNSVPNSNSGTKTITSSDANWYTGNVDMGATNTYRYVNAVNVYNKGKQDGAGTETTLWTNPNPGTTYDGGYANLSASVANYAKIKIYFRPSTAVTTESYIIIPKPTTVGNPPANTATFALSAVGPTPAYGNYVRYGFFSSNTQVYFNIAMQHQAYIDDNNCIPTKICGIS